MSTNGPSISDLLAGIESAVQSVSLSDLPTLLGDLERVKALGWGRMLTGPHNGQGERDLLTVPEVAQRLKVSQYRAYELVRRGEIKKTRLGEKSVRVKTSDLAEYLSKQGG